MTHQPNLDNPQVTHEPRDVPISGILYFLLALVAAIAATMLLVMYLFQQFERGSAAADPGAPPLASERTGPPSPRLQYSPVEDLTAMRTEETRILNSYGWVDAADQVIRIPIHRAMEIVAEQGLPQWSAAGNQQQQGAEGAKPAEPGLDNQPPQQSAPMDNQSAPMGNQSAPMGEQPAPDAQQPQTQPAPSGEAPAPSQPAPQNQPQPAPQDQPQPDDVEASVEPSATPQNESEQAQ